MPQPATIPTRQTFVFVSAIFFCGWTLGTPASAENWPGWRGPRGDGTSTETDLPQRWSATDNIAWKTELSGVGHSSPIVWGDRIFTETCVEESEERVLVCLDRASGQILWQQAVLRSPLEDKHHLNSRASSTPATDGQAVYCTFLDQQDVVVAAYDFDGRRQWLVRPGIFSSKHGFCSSPVLFENLVIVNGDHDGDAYIVALDRSTGEVVWRTPRENKTRSYVTPIIRNFDGREQLILSGSLCVASYDPRSGKRHWIIDGPTEQFVASIVDNGKLLFMTCGFPDKHIMAIRPDGKGNVTDTHIAWRTTENASYVPSPVAVGDYFLLTSDAGIASCFEAETGKRVWRERLGRHYSASPITAAGLAYFVTDDGLFTVLRPGPTFDVVATNDLGEACYASPAASQGQIFQRAEKHLYAIGARRLARTSP